MCVSKPATVRTSAFIDIVKVAVISSKINAPSLAPYVLYMHGDDQRYEDEDTLSRWLKSQGVRVVNSRLSFAKDIPPIRWRMKTLTGVCKMDIARAAVALSAELVSRRLDPERVLWTDADVLWSGDWDHSSPSLPTFAAGTEHFSRSLNSGVILGNTTTLAAAWPRMLRFAIGRRFKFAVADQSWLNLFWGDAWERLDNAKYNARAFVHPEPPRRPRASPRPRGRRGRQDEMVAVAPLEEPRVWHWHGYKPSDVRCWLRAMANGSWPERAWRPLSCKERRKGSCSYKPIRGSGCRYLGRITPSPCYLRTYTILLMEHERFLALA